MSADDIASSIRSAKSKADVLTLTRQNLAEFRANPDLSETAMAKLRDLEARPSTPSPPTPTPSSPKPQPGVPARPRPSTPSLWDSLTRGAPVGNDWGSIHHRST